MLSLGCTIHPVMVQTLGAGGVTEVLRLHHTLSHHLEWKASHGAFSKEASL